jgi:hypothetical protein
VVVEATRGDAAGEGSGSGLGGGAGLAAAVGEAASVVDGVKGPKLGAGVGAAATLVDAAFRVIHHQVLALPAANMTTARRKTSTGRAEPDSRRRDGGAVVVMALTLRDAGCPGRKWLILVRARP